MYLTSCMAVASARDDRELDTDPRALIGRRAWRPRVEPNDPAAELGLHHLCLSLFWPDEGGGQ
jgi:hypothetical protein